MKNHLTELPNKILVGNDVIEESGSFLKKLNFSGKVLIISGQTHTIPIKKKLIQILESEGFQVSSDVVNSTTLEEVNKIVDKSKKEIASVIIGLGGGKTDVAKLASHKVGIPFVNIPTSGSHDGIASPFASIKNLERAYSYLAKPPIGILADINIITNAPKKLLVSGCGDLVSKITAIKDWMLARDEVKEYYGQYAANLARLSAEIILSESELIGKGGIESTRMIVEALISSGVAAGIAGSSRPCSGSEHLFSHALDIVAPSIGLHGEKCALGTIMMMKLHGLDWQKAKESFEKMNIPTKAQEIGLSKEQVIKALIKAPSTRPERYTILNKIELDDISANELAKSTGII